jgi:hypothetical protein
MAQYPDFLTATRYGYADGLKGVNCRHDYFYVDEHSPPAYTDRQLSEMQTAENAIHAYDTIDRSGKPVTKEYTLRGIADRMRDMERQMRKTRQRVAGYKAGGLDEDAAAERAKYHNQRREYERFCKHFGELGFYPEWNRIINDGLGRV